MSQEGLHKRNWHPRFRRIVLTSLLCLLPAFIQRAQEPEGAGAAEGAGSDPQAERREARLCRVRLTQWMDLLAAAQKGQLPLAVETATREILKLDPGNRRADQARNPRQTSPPPARTTPILRAVRDVRSRREACLGAIAAEQAALAQWYQRQGQADEALRHAQEAVLLFPDEETARAVLGQVRTEPYGWLDPEIAECIRSKQILYEGTWRPEEEVTGLRRQRTEAAREGLGLPGAPVVCTAYMDLTGDISPSQLESIGRELDAFYVGIYRHMFGTFPVELKPVRCALLGSEESYRRCLRHVGQGDRAENTWGIYCNGTLFYGVAQSALGTAVHELIHAVSAQVLDTGHSMVVEEGLGTFGELATPNQFGPIQAHHIQAFLTAVGRNGHHSTEEMIARGDAAYSRDPALGYGQGVCLVGMLHHLGVLPEFLRRWNDHPEDGVAILQEILWLDNDQILEAIQDHARGRR